MIAKLIPKTFSHVTEMRFSKKLIPKQFFHVILWITNEHVIRSFREINSREIFSCNWNVMFGEINFPKTKIYACNIFWLECK